MGRVWLQNGRLITPSTTGRVCKGEYCPCGYTSTDQCYVVYFAMYCPTGGGTWLTVAQAESVLGASLESLGTNIYRIPDNESDGCWDLSELGYTPGWQGWCKGNIYEPCAECPSDAIVEVSNTWIGEPGCKPPNTQYESSDCSVGSLPGLPANPLALDPC